MTTKINVNNYNSSFELLLKDFFQILEFIEPANKNKNTFSHRIYGLLLRVCTDFESLAKDLLIEAGYNKNPKDMTVSDYKTLETKLCLENVKVIFIPWQPKPLNLTPFKKWSTSKPTLSWYKQYNTVKHNRLAEFSQANLNTLIESIAGLFAIIAKICNFNWSHSSWTNERKRKRKYNYTFIRKPFRMYGT